MRGRIRACDNVGAAIRKNNKEHNNNIDDNTSGILSESKTLMTCPVSKRRTHIQRQDEPECHKDALNMAYAAA
jgi:hypothetical protein